MRLDLDRDTINRFPAFDDRFDEWTSDRWQQYDQGVTRASTAPRLCASSVADATGTAGAWWQSQAWTEFGHREGRADIQRDYQRESAARDEAAAEGRRRTSTRGVSPSRDAVTTGWTGSATPTAAPLHTASARNRATSSASRARARPPGSATRRRTRTGGANAPNATSATCLRTTTAIATDGEPARGGAHAQRAPAAYFSPPRIRRARPAKKPSTARRARCFSVPWWIGHSRPGTSSPALK